MDRVRKGTSVSHYVSDYSVIDLETTGIYVNSAKIVEISAVRVRNGQVVDEYSTLVNPGCHIPEEASEVNHITDDMVKNAPTLEEVINDFLDFVGSDVILGYNNAGFDMNIIYDANLRINNSYFENDYIDLLHSARKCLMDLDNCRLETVCKFYSLDTTGEHRALKDCYLTKECYDRIFHDYGDIAFERSSRHGGGKYKNNYSQETIRLQELQSFLESIVLDGIVSEEEFDVLNNWVEENRDLRGIYPFDRVFDAIDKVLEDGFVTNEEREELQELFSSFVDPVGSESIHEQIVEFEGKHICVTGEFEYGSRNDIVALIENSGAIFDKGVKKATDYLVVGSQGSENWKTGNYGGKILKAMELNEKGATIKIIEEADFIKDICKKLGRKV